MTETVAIARPSVTKPVSRQRSAKPVLVSASVLAQHLDCSRTYIGKVEAEGVIQRHGDGFPLDQSRVAYSAEADAANVKVRTEMLQLSLMETKRELVRREEVDCHPDPDRVSSLPVRCAPRGDAAPREHGSSNFPVHVDEREV